MPDIASAYPSSLPLSGGTVTGNLTIDGILSTANGPILVLQATTGVAGFALQNATPTIISWTAPNDGQMHRFQLFAVVHVSSNETGGAIATQWTAPGGQSGLSTPFAGGSGSGLVLTAADRVNLVEPGTTVSLVQSTALSGGAAVVWAEIWAS